MANTQSHSHNGQSPTERPADDFLAGINPDNTRKDVSHDLAIWCSASEYASVVHYIFGAVIF